jgi:hypothetical protein
MKRLDAGLSIIRGLRALEHSRYLCAMWVLSAELHSLYKEERSRPREWCMG